MSNVPMLEARINGLLSATNGIVRDYKHSALIHEYLEEIEMVRDRLSEILDRAWGKTGGDSGETV